MPSTWTEKQERKYEHIRDSERQQGASPRRAEEIASRTVNKERAQSGQTQTASRSSTSDMSSSRRGGLRSGTGRTKGRTKARVAKLRLARPGARPPKSSTCLKRPGRAYRDIDSGQCSIDGIGISEVRLTPRRSEST